MRSAFVILLTAFMHIGTITFAQHITLKQTDAPLQTIFKEIRKQSGYDFLYNEQLMKNLRPVSINVKDVRIEQALDSVFFRLPLTYTIDNKIIMVSAKEQDTVIQALQRYSISGRIIDKQGQPLPGAGVYLSNYKISTVADENGNYRIRGLLPGNYTVLVQMMGYLPGSQNVIISNRSTEFDLVLDESVKILKEVVVRPDYYRNVRLKIFRESFLGTSRNADRCEILNPEVILFEYDAIDHILRAKANEFLVIENKALGYRIRYLLEYFEKDEVTNIVHYYGYPYFEELEPAVAKRKRYAEKRRLAYAGSPQHFFKSLYANVNEEEGFVINKMIKVHNPKRLPDPFIDKKIKFYSESLRKKARVKHANDSLGYYIKMKTEPDTLEVLIRKEIPADSLVKEKQLPLTTMRFKDALYIVYKGEKESSDFRKYPEFKINRPEDLAKYQISLVYQLANSVSFYENGGIYDPGSLLCEGVWAYKNVGDLLPMDYVMPHR
jgi:hypothetical protein